MRFSEHYFHVLLVSSSEKMNSALPTYLMGSDFEIGDVVKSASQAKRYLQERKYDLVIINTPLLDETGVGIAEELSEDAKALCLVLLKGEQLDIFSERLKEKGIFYLPKPLPVGKLNDTLLFLATTLFHKRKIEMKTISLEDKMKEIRLVNKAKWFLIEKERLTEAEAHRYVEKSAMDRGLTKLVVANEIIAKYE